MLLIDRQVSPGRCHQRSETQLNILLSDASLLRLNQDVSNGQYWDPDVIIVVIKTIGSTWVC
jgi:hypothetical protein